MEITAKDRDLINEWIALHTEIEKREEELTALFRDLKKISNKLYDKNSREKLEEFRDYLTGEIGKLSPKNDKDRIKQLTNLKMIVEHDINIEDLVEQEIDIEEKGTNIDLKDYDKT